MNQKWWLDSQTVRSNLAIILGAVTLIARGFGVEIGAEEVQSILDGITGCVIMVLAVISIVGRFKARHALSLKRGRE